MADAVPPSKVEKGISRYWVLAWIPTAAVAAVLLTPPGEDFRTRYAYGWYAVGLVLLSVVGRRRPWLAIAAQCLVAATALYIDWMWITHFALTHRGTDWPFIVGSTTVIGLATAQMAGLYGVRKRLDPVIMAAIQLGIGQVTVWTYYAITGLGVEQAGQGPITWTGPLSAELPYLALALAAAGLGVQRTFGSALQRLGLTSVSWWQPLVGVGFAAFALLLSTSVYDVTYLLSPGMAAQMNAVGAVAGPPVPLALLLAFDFMAGIGEETLFRGALQPRAGVVLTAALFTSIHSQYGFTPVLVTIFLHGLGYGLIRRYINTTTAIIAHSVYDVFVDTGWLADKEWIVVLMLLIPLVWKAVRVPAGREALATLWAPGLCIVLLLSSAFVASTSMVGAQLLAATGLLLWAVHTVVNLPRRPRRGAGAAAAFGFGLCAVGAIAEIWLQSRALETGLLGATLIAGVVWLWWASSDVAENGETSEVAPFRPD